MKKTYTSVVLEITSSADVITTSGTETEFIPFGSSAVQSSAFEIATSSYLTESAFEL